MNRRLMLSMIAMGATVPTLAIAQDRRLGESAERYMRNTLLTGSVALATSQVAEERARNPWVKKFATYEREEQEGLAQILESLGATPARRQEAEQEDAVRRLRDNRGERFEMEYLEAQAEGHQKLLRIQEEYISSGRNDELQNIAKLVRGRVQEHIDLIRTIREQMRA